MRPSTFRQAVREFRPSQLLPLLAQMSVRSEPNFRSMDEIRRLPPWLVAAVARESVVWGNEHRSKVATPDDVRRLMNMQHRVEPERPAGTLQELVGPILAEQAAWHSDLFSEQSRAIPLYFDPAYGDAFDWPAIFGMELPRAVRAVQVVDASVRHLGGRWDPRHLDPAEFDRLSEFGLSRSDVAIMAEHLTATPAQLRARTQALPPLPVELAKQSPNPLQMWPLVDLGKPGIWAPAGPLLVRALWSDRLSFRGLAAWGISFAQRLGARHQAYVGDLLAELGDVFPEREYERGSLSVDWIWRTPQGLVLVECKSMRMNIDAHGGSGSFEALADRLNAARAQIDRTASLIRSGHPEFSEFDPAAPIVGIVATAEPFHLANAGLEEWHQQSETITAIASLHELEMLVSLGADAAQRLFGVLADPERRTWNLQQSLLPLPEGGEVAALSRGWQTIWPDQAKRDDAT